MDDNKTARMSLGSLFDGIGGFPYAGSFFGIQPLWASEILPQAVSATKRHFPDMEHVGDITKLSGATLRPTQIITFGSPCQDLSTAGKRAGIGGSRSNLFYEAIRIIDEMREATNGEYPKYAIWENVPGALSSGHPRGADFCAVLEAFTKTEVPMPDSGNWANAGMVRGDRVNLAWRVLNAQHHGVPQRRRRIFLVASFGAGRADEVLFVEKGLRRYLAAGGEAGEGIAAYAERGAGSAMPGDGGGLGANKTDNRAICYQDIVSALTTELAHQTGTHGQLGGQLIVEQTEEPAGVLVFAANQRDEVRDLGAASGALQAQPGMKQQTFVAQETNGTASPRSGLTGAFGDVAGTLDANYHKGTGARSGVERDVVLCAATGQSHAEILENLSATLNCTSEQPIIAKRNCLTPWDVQSRRIHGDGGAWPTLYGEQGGGHGYAAQLQQPPLGAHCLNPWDTQESRVFMEDGVSPTMAGADGGGGRNPVGLLLKLADSPPVAAFCGGASAEARSIGYSEKVSPTLKAEAGGFTAPCVCEPLTARTLTARGDGSPNVDSGPNVVAYGITSQSANSMRSSNPHSGIYEADASKTLDTSGVNPSANQGGIAVVNRQPALTMRLREGCEGGGKGPLLQNEMSGALATGNDQYLFSPCAVGVHQNQAGDVNVSETAYTLATNSNATGRNAPLVAHEQATAAGVISKGDGDCFITPEFHGALSCGGGMPGQGYPAALVPRSEIPLDVHPDVAGTLCASGAGLSRPAGMASEPDLCVAYALAGNMIGRQDCNGPQGSGVREEASFTLNATDIQGVATINASGEPIPIHDRATRCQGGGDTRNGDGCGNGLGVGKPGDPAPTLLTGDHHMVAAVFNREYSSVFKEASVVGTQTARQCKDETALVCDCGVSAVDCRNYKEIGDCSGTLQAKDKPGYSLNYQNPVKVPVNGARYIVRRLTPTECERLQGYPDGWTKFGHDGKEISDTRRYQMLGNSICVPVVAFVLGSIAAQIHNEGRDEND